MPKYPLLGMTLTELQSVTKDWGCLLLQPNRSLPGYTIKK